MSVKHPFPMPVRLLALALLGGGGLGMLVNIWVIPAAWPWELPLLAHRFLAAAGAAYFIGSLLVLRKSTWVAAELLILTVLVYGFPLLVAILVDYDQVDWRTVTAKSFLGIVVAALAVCVWYGWTGRRKGHSTTQLLSPQSRTFLLGLGIISGVVGVLVYLIPKQAGLIWPWAGLAAWKPLDSRLIASMLLTIAVLAFYTWHRQDRDAWEITTGMLLAYCLVAGFGLALHAAATPAFLLPDIAYIVIFVITGLLAWRLPKPGAP